MPLPAFTQQQFTIDNKSLQISVPSCARNRNRKKNIYKKIWNPDALIHFLLTPRGKCGKTRQQQQQNPRKEEVEVYIYNQ